jgi:muramoyltetrapeptide carboxypeptidase
MAKAALVPAPRLRPGDVVRIVAPAGPAREDELERGLAVLSRRYVPRYDEGLSARQGYLAGDDDRRARELAAALADPEARAIIALRGGYGTMRLLRRVAPAVDALRAAPKAIIGSSDLCALGGLLQTAGVGWVHGPMVRTLGRTDDASIERLWQVLEDPGSVDDSTLGLRGLSPGRARGPLLGGNLSVLAALAGTGFLPDFTGAVVLFEDVGERPYRLDRLVTQLRLAGVLDAAAGFLLGEFTDCAGGANDPTPEEVVAGSLTDLGVPVVAGFPTAHGARCFATRMGELVQIDGDAGTFGGEGET